MTDIVVPSLGESVSEATVAQWLKKAGEHVSADEPLVELETDKVTLEVNAPSEGVLSEIKVEAGQNVEVGAILGAISAGNGKAAAAPVPARKETPPAPAAEDSEQTLSPAVRKLVEENDLDPASIKGSGKEGRILKGDVLDYLEHHKKGEIPPEEKSAPTAATSEVTKHAPPRAQEHREERVRMTRLRQRVAERLKDAQNTAAMLTTFNEVDMGHVMALRNQYKESFEKKHGVKLGFMSFFVKASIQALREFPAVNAQIDGDELVYKNHYDIGVAVSTPQGLVVPVLRDADTQGFADIERNINDLGKRARDGKLGMEELVGGTFTITNGGVFGSLMSTPILNPPQSGILGMHKIQERPMAVNGEVVVRPMMYLALTYDHRIIDGREAVSFLVRIKDAIEDPQRLMLEL